MTAHFNNQTVVTGLPKHRSEAFLVSQTKYVVTDIDMLILYT